jgi:excisionase family DNA binding protein
LSPEAIKVTANVFTKIERYPFGILKILHYSDAISTRSAGAMATAKSSGILTIKEVADFLKVTERTIYRLAAAKQIPAFKVGGSWRFSQADIAEWIKQQAVDDRIA